MGSKVRKNSYRSPSKVRYLNVIALLVAVPAFGYAFILGAPHEYALNMRDMLAGASASLSVAVPPNQYNTLAEQLAAKEARLNQREAEMAQKTADARPNTLPELNLGTISFAGSLVLFVLVGANFYMDFRRERQRSSSRKFAVDLRQ